MFILTLFLCQEIFDDAAEGDDSTGAVGFNCKSKNKGTNKKIALIQISTSNNSIFLFDILANPDLMELGRLKELIENEKILKVRLFGSRK